VGYETRWTTSDHCSRKIQRGVDSKKFSDCGCNILRESLSVRVSHGLARMLDTTGDSVDTCTCRFAGSGVYRVFMEGNIDCR
jgi:hypothetical protein